MRDYDNRAKIATEAECAIEIPIEERIKSAKERVGRVKRHIIRLKEDGDMLASLYKRWEYDQYDLEKMIGKNHILVSNAKQDLKCAKRQLKALKAESK